MKSPDCSIAQIDSAVEKATDRGRTAVAMKLADEQRKARADLAGQRTKEAQTLADLKVAKASIDGERRVVEADLGPISCDTARRRRSGRAAVLHPGHRPAARPGRGAVAARGGVGPALTFTNPALPSARSYPGGKDGNFD